MVMSYKLIQNKPYSNVSFLIEMDSYSASRPGRQELEADLSSSILSFFSIRGFGRG